MTGQYELSPILAFTPIRPTRFRSLYPRYRAPNGGLSAAYPEAFGGARFVRPAERNQKKPASSRTDWPCHARSTRGFKLLPEYEKRPCVVARSFGRLMSRPVLAQHRRPLRQRQELSGSVMIRRRNRRGTGPPSIESHLRLFPQLSLALTTPGKFGPWHRRQY